MSAFLYRTGIITRHSLSELEILLANVRASTHRIAKVKQEMILYYEQLISLQSFVTTPNGDGTVTINYWYLEFLYSLLA